MRRCLLIAGLAAHLLVFPSWASESSPGGNRLVEAASKSTKTEDWAILSYVKDSSGRPVDVVIEDTSFAPFAEQELAALASEPSSKMDPDLRDRVLRAHGFDPRTIPRARETTPRNFVLVYDPPHEARPLRSFDVDFRTVDARDLPAGKYYLRLSLDSDALVQQAELLGRRDLPIEVADFIADNLVVTPSEDLPERWIMILSLRILGGEASAIVSAFGLSETGS